MDGRQVYRFPPSQEFAVRPQFVEVPQGLQLTFDQEGPTGEYEPCSLLFQGVLGYKCTRLVATSAWMTKAYDVLIELDDSPWLRELRSHYHGSNELSHKHYVVFFDDHGFYEVVASAFTPRSTPSQ